MSCSKGSSNRTRPQKHQNRSAFKNDLHDTSKKTKFLNSMQISGVCGRCKEIIEWKIKYKKYKPLTAPRKCIGCDQKSIKHAYHMLCTNCALEKKVCSKCNIPMDSNVDDMKDNGKTDECEIQSILKNLPERKRRTILRHLNKESELSKEEKLNTILSGMEQINIDDDDCFSEEINDSDYEEELLILQK